MANNYNIYPEEETMSMASEPAMEYGVTHRHRVVPIAEVMRHSMTVDESERLITEKIYRHFNVDL